MGERVRKRRKELKMSQAELAKKAGISRVQVSNIERGIHKNIRLTTIRALSSALELTVEELFLC